ncbi:hypothetical protein NQZ68_040564, partial [Dissostichus eleginoides]
MTREKERSQREGGTSLTGFVVSSSLSLITPANSTTSDNARLQTLISTRFNHQTDHMNIEEYFEDDEEPPLLLSSCPSHGVWLYWDCSSAVSVGGRMCVSAMPCRPGAFQGLWADPKSSRGVQCQLCPTGSFSDALDSEPCVLHTACEVLGRKATTPGSATSDAVCGDCLPGCSSIAKEGVSTQ